jgi:hypothetical protein
MGYRQRHGTNWAWQVPALWKCRWCLHGVPSVSLMVVWCVQIKRLTVGVLWPLFKGVTVVAAAATTVGRVITFIVGVIARRR